MHLANGRAVAQLAARVLTPAVRSSVRRDATGVRVSGGESHERELRRHCRRLTVLDAVSGAELSRAIISPAERPASGVESTGEVPSGHDRRKSRTRHRHWRGCVTRSAVSELPVRTGAPAPDDAVIVDTAAVRRTGGDRPERVLASDARR